MAFRHTILHGNSLARGAWSKVVPPADLNSFIILNTTSTPRPDWGRGTGGAVERAGVGTSSRILRCPVSVLVLVLMLVLVLLVALFLVLALVLMLLLVVVVLLLLLLLSLPCSSTRWKSSVIASNGR